MLSTTVVRSCVSRVTVAARPYSRSAAVRSEPKLHNATGRWDALKSKRPIDEDELHVSC